MHRLTSIMLRLIAVTAALGCCCLVLFALGTSPLDTFRMIAEGALSSPGKIAYVLTAWVPVLLCCSGLLITFRTGLWNIGIEGQIVMGAIFATAVLRLSQDTLPPPITLTLALLAAMLGGMIWAIGGGILKLYGQVNEIFSGLGLNFIAGSITVYLVLGLWKRPGIGSTSGTVPFAPKLWLPAIQPEFNVSWVEVALGLAAISVVAILLANTHFGLRLKAIGKNLRATFLMGVPTDRYMLTAFGLCGSLAGLAGFVLVAGTSSRHQLYPLISGGYGFLAILVVLLGNSSPLTIIPISILFTAISMGSLQLAMQAQLDTSIAGVIQGMLVLTVLITSGVRQRLMEREK